MSFWVPAAGSRVLIAEESFDFPEHHASSTKKKRGGRSLREVAISMLDYGFLGAGFLAAGAFFAGAFVAGAALGFSRPPIRVSESAALNGY